LPKDLVDLAKVWLSDRKFYVDINGQCYAIHESDSDTVQGSDLGSLLHAIFVSTLFDPTNISNFVDDNYVVAWKTVNTNLIVDLEKELERNDNQVAERFLAPSYC
jgi:hypothetical protein